MRLYKFLEEKYALEAIRDNRLKLSELEALNDPLEFKYYAFSADQDQDTWDKTLAVVNKRYTLLSFSKTNSNPLLWGHYADKHKGICLGFELTEDFGQMFHIKYAPNRVILPKDRLTATNNQDLIMDTIFTKYSDWSYEDEVRFYLNKPQSDENGLYFLSFTDLKIELKEVIFGIYCTNSSIQKSNSLEYKKATLASDRYAIETKLC